MGYISKYFQMIKKLLDTKLWAEEQLESSILLPVEGRNIYLSKDALMEELKLIHRSLCETDNAITADGFLSDIIRNVTAFGLTLVTLDVRQESGRHEEAVDSITKYLGLGSYSQWDEDTKITWLQQQIASPRPLIRPGVWNENPDFFSPTAVDTLEIFEMIAEQHEGSLSWPEPKF